MSHHLRATSPEPPARDRLQKVPFEGWNHHPRDHQTQSPARTRHQPPPGSGAREGGACVLRLLVLVAVEP